MLTFAAIIEMGGGGRGRVYRGYENCGVRVHLFGGLCFCFIIIKKFCENFEGRVHFYPTTPACIYVQK